MKYAEALSIKILHKRRDRDLQYGLKHLRSSSEEKQVRLETRDTECETALKLSILKKLVRVRKEREFVLLLFFNLIESGPISYFASAQELPKCSGNYVGICVALRERCLTNCVHVVRTGWCASLHQSASLTPPAPPMRQIAFA